MSISEKTIKLLWGLSGGICANPDCRAECIPFVRAADPTLIGEMAHVIAKHPGGPRGQAAGGSDEYENLVLLCPTCHTLIDKAKEGAFPEELLRGWKKDHETWVRSRLSAPVITDREQLCEAILRLLIENRATWRTYGPESDIALEDPVSNVARLWVLRKLSEIVPKNSMVVNMIRRYSDWFSPKEYEKCAEFMEHAAGFERSAYDRMDRVPRFPAQFEEMIRRGAG